VIGATLSIIDPIPIANIEVALAAIRAAAEPVASQPVLVLRLEPMQDAGAMQNVVNQRVDGQGPWRGPNTNSISERVDDREGGDGADELWIALDV
jgi:hypothetical protein